MAKKPWKPGKKGRTGPKHTPTQLEEVKARVALLDRMGYSQSAIARDVKVSQPQVCEYLKTIRAEYRERRFQGQDDRVGEMLAQLRDLTAVAWRNMERSEEDARRVILEVLKPAAAGRGKAGADNGGHPPRTLKGYQKTITQVEGRLAKGEYMQVVLECVKLECDLMGYYAPKKVDQKNLNVNFDWEALARAGRERRGPGGARADPIAERLRAEHERLKGGGGSNGHANGAQADEGS